MQSRNNAIPPSAFTLIEVLVAMAALAILLVLLLNVLTSTTTLWRHSENRADAFREARAALTFIARDMASAIPILTHGEEVQALLAPDTAADWAANRDAVFFLAALPPSAQKGGENSSDICAVGYFLAFAASGGGGSPTMNLYRYLLSSDETFEALKDSNGWPLPSRLADNPGAVLKDISPASAHVDLLARNIREFRVEPVTYARQNPDGTYMPVFSPDKVEITIVAASRETAEKFPDKSDWIEKHRDRCPCALCRTEQTFTTSIPLRTKL